MSDIRATSCAEKPWINAAQAASDTPTQIAGSPRGIQACPGLVEAESASVASETRVDETWRAAPSRRDLCADCRNEPYRATILRVGQRPRAPDSALRGDIMETGCAVLDGPVAELTRNAQLRQACMGL